MGGSSCVLATLTSPDSLLDTEFQAQPQFYWIEWHVKKDPQVGGMLIQFWEELF